jgi:hypothetical protein
MPRPHVALRCVADAYADKSCERIVEFGTTGRQGGGGLINIRNHPDGTTSVHVYCADRNVKAFIPITSEDRKP